MPERVPGSDLVLSLPEAAAQAGVSVFLLGGNPGVAAAAAGRLRARYPGLQNVESYCPPFGFEDDPQELDRIKEALRGAQPALVLVGLGFPKQEKLISWLRYELPQTWFVGVGISLSFLAGSNRAHPLSCNAWVSSGCTAFGTSPVDCSGGMSFRVSHSASGFSPGRWLIGWAGNAECASGAGAAALFPRAAGSPVGHSLGLPAAIDR